MSHLPPEFYDKWKPFMMGSGLGALFLGVLLFSGGLFLTMRKRSASMILNGWALLKMVVGMVSTYFSFRMQREEMPLKMEYQKEVMKKAGAGGEQLTDFMTGITEFATLIGLVMGLGWLMVLPTFMLIWFIRPKIRKEIAGWGREVSSEL